MYTINHITKAPIEGEKNRWLVQGTVMGEDAPQFQIWGDRIGMLAMAGYDLRGWYNAPEYVLTQIWVTVDVIVGKSSRGYPKIVSVKDTTTGRWISRIKQELVNVGDTLIFKGEGFPREVVVSIHTASDGGRRFEFESGGHHAMSPAQEIMVLRD